MKNSKSTPKKELKVKNYIFNFEGGGWNTITGKTKRGAYKNAVKKFGDMSVVDSKSFRIWSLEDYNNCLASFY